MDQSLLSDPGFWQSARPVAMGAPPTDLRRFPALEGHVLFQTSGSSGTPKWIALSKDALLLSAAAVNRHLRVDEHSRWGLALPMHHVGGFGVVARAFEAACGIARLAGRWQAREFGDWLAKKKITHTSLVPTQVHDLVAAGASAPPGLAAVVVGGGHLDDAAGEAARRLGWPVLASYGMTEAGSQIATAEPSSLDQPYRHAPLPLLPIWDVAADDDGILKIAGPALFSGSLVMARNQWEFVPRVGNWHISSDRVLISPEGITPLGRADAMVKVLGELVDPCGIERKLLALAAGRLRAGTFAVAALPDARAGHRLVPVFEAGVGNSVAEETLAAYQAAAPGYARLAAPVWLERLPRSDLGKLRRRELTESLLR